MSDKTVVGCNTFSRGKICVCNIPVSVESHKKTHTHIQSGQKNRKNSPAKWKKCRTIIYLRSTNA